MFNKITSYIRKIKLSLNKSVNVEDIDAELAKYNISFGDTDSKKEEKEENIIPYPNDDIPYLFHIFRVKYDVPMSFCKSEFFNYVTTTSLSDCNKYFQLIGAKDKIIGSHNTRFQHNICYIDSINKLTSDDINLFTNYNTTIENGFKTYICDEFGVKRPTVFDFDTKVREMVRSLPNETNGFIVLVTRYFTSFDKQIKFITEKIECCEEKCKDLLSKGEKMKYSDCTSILKEQLILTDIDNNPLTLMEITNLVNELKAEIEEHKKYLKILTLAKNQQNDTLHRNIK